MARYAQAQIQASAEMRISRRPRATALLALREPLSLVGIDSVAHAVRSARSEIDTLNDRILYTKLQSVRHRAHANAMDDIPALLNIVNDGENARGAVVDRGQ